MIIMRDLNRETMGSRAQSIRRADSKVRHKKAAGRCGFTGDFLRYRTLYGKRRENYEKTFDDGIISDSDGGDDSGWMWEQ